MVTRYTRQLPEQLRVLREYVMIEGAVFSNRIEGVVGFAEVVSRLSRRLCAPVLRDAGDASEASARDITRSIHAAPTNNL
jgi:hypothetical protein